MRKLNFKYLAARNFVCFGPEGIEIDLTKKQPMVLVRGDNLDVFEDEERIASNGVGKSSLADVLVFTLFGKPIKNPKKLKLADLINNKCKSDGLRTEVRWDQYRVVRTYRKSQKVRLYEWDEGESDWRDISPGGKTPTEEEIEKRLGMTFESFVNVVVFTDNNAGTFLESDAETKRKIIDNLLSLHRFQLLREVSEDYRKDAKSAVKELKSLVEQMTDTLETYKDRIQGIVDNQKKWRAEKIKELQLLANRLQATKKELEQESDQGAELAAYEEAQTKIHELSMKTPELEKNDDVVNDVMSKLQASIDKLQSQRSQLTLDLQNHQSSLHHAQNSIRDRKKAIVDLESQEGTKCPTCFGVVKKENYIDVVENLRQEIQEQEVVAEKAGVAITGLETQIEEINATIAKQNQNLGVCKQKSSEIANRLAKTRQEISKLAGISKPESGVDEALLLQKIAQIKEQAIAKKAEAEGPTPYDEILASAQEDVERQRAACKVKETALAEAEESAPYYQFMVNAFRTEIRRFIIDDILPGLNNKVSYWLQFLIDGKIRLKFDNELAEQIDRNPPDGDPFVYHAMSGGERRRINLAVSQAFAYIMMLSAGCSPSIVFLDEVTTNVDPIGVEGIYQMIQELVREKQVFITTHDQGLLDKLDGCDKIVLQKKDGFTKLI